MPARKPRSVLPLADVLGHGASDKRIDILRRIGEAGSISEAARASGVSYKAAWQALETLANLAGVPLVEKAVGGSGGGGARLTAAGLQVLQAADALQQSRARTLAELARTPSRPADVDTGALQAQAGVQRAALALRTSMRNQFSCVVASLRPVQGMVRVRLTLAEDLVLHSRITRESAQLLGLQAGLPVLALCKATAVTVAARSACGWPRVCSWWALPRPDTACGPGSPRRPCWTNRRWCWPCRAERASIRDIPVPVAGIGR